MKKWTIILAVILFTSNSCQKESQVESLESFSLNYDLFETYKDFDFSIPGSDLVRKGGSSADYQGLLDQVNMKFGSDLELLQLDYQLINKKTKKSSPSEEIEKFLNDTDVILLKVFEENLLQSDFNNAIESLEVKLLELNVSKNEFEKYNTFINILLLLERNDPSLFQFGSVASKTKACKKAIAAYSLATVGLAGCGFTGPAAVAVCAVAIVSKVLAFDMMVEECGKEEAENNA